MMMDPFWGRYMSYSLNSPYISSGIRDCYRGYGEGYWGLRLWFTYSPFPARASTLDSIDSCSHVLVHSKMLEEAFRSGPMAYKSL